ncbi:hypothetical protein [Kitasatospora sp. HPMI-4]|uniref:hypothetical protein n=1 Tax=Kitasatospora sp. HPMI-4 TaxID=3448443 RepID=UPI003F1D6BBC
MGSSPRPYLGLERAGARSGRHGRPRPFRGFRLPSLRFSGAAMAMSTVLGISVATTWLLTEQQNIGRSPGMSNVGASPPLPSPDAAGTTDRPATQAPAPRPTSTASAGAGAVGTPRTSPRTTTAPSATAPSTIAPSATAPSTIAPSTTAPAPGSPSASPSASVGVRPSASAPAPTVPRPTAGTAGPGTPSGSPAPGSSPQPDHALSGLGSYDAVGTTGVRHTLALTVGENVTALQVELRLARPETLPGTTPWSSVPGAVVTVTQDRTTLIYRFTAPVGLDLTPGSYTFGVRGARPADTPDRLPQESWAASAFALDNPRALAVRGTFAP